MDTERIFLSLGDVANKANILIAYACGVKTIFFHFHNLPTHEKLNETICCAGTERNVFMSTKKLIKVLCNSDLFA